MTTDIIIETEPPYTLEDQIKDNQARQEFILETLATLEVLEEQADALRMDLSKIMNPRKAYELLYSARAEIQNVRKDRALDLYKARKHGDYLKTLDKSQAV